jgi:hypothetical protein
MGLPPSPTIAAADTVQLGKERFEQRVFLRLATIARRQMLLDGCAIPISIQCVSMNSIMNSLN